MNYEQNLREKAEQLVKERYSETYRLATQGANYKWANGYYKKQLEYMIERMMPIARIALEWCAESITNAMIECMPQESEAYNNVDLKYIIQGYLAANGLIPPVTPEPKPENWSL